MRESVPPQMIRHRSPCGLHHIGLCVNPRGDAPLMAAPVIQKFWHMHHLLCPVRQPQDHVVILAAVKPGAEQLRPVQELSVEDAEMADIIVGTQVVHRIVRLEMHGQHLIDVPAPESGLITVNVVRIPLIDCLHIFVQGAWMKNIVMVKQPRIFPRCHFQTLVCIAGNTLVLRKLPVDDPSPAVRLRIFQTDLPHAFVPVVRAVRKAQLPVLIGLVQNRIQHFPEEILRRVKERDKNADLHPFRKNSLPLLLPCLLIRKARRPVALHGLSLDPLVFQLGHNPPQIPAVFQPIPLAQQKVHASAQGCGRLPEGIVPDPVQLKGKLLVFRLQHGHPLRKIRRLDVFFFIRRPVIFHFPLPPPEASSC